MTSQEKTPRWSLIAPLALTACALAQSALAASFVYTAVPAAPCASESACAPPYVLVVDATTAEIVLRLPLPVHTEPAGMAISPDGAHLYVSNRAAELSGATSMTVIDARQHRLLASYPLAADQYGLLAVRGDDSRVFIAAGQRLFAFDTSSHHTVDSVRVSAPNFIRSVKVSTALDRVFVVLQPYILGYGAVGAFDAGTLARLGEVEPDPSRSALGMTLSPDQQRLDLMLSGNASFPSSGGELLFLDPASLATISSSGILWNSGDPAEIPGSGEILAGGFGNDVYRYPSFRPFPVPGQVLAITVPSENRAFVTTEFDSRLDAGSAGLSAIDLATDAVVRTIRLAPQASSYLTSTPPDAAACAYRLDSAYSSFPVTGGSVSLRLTTTCDWEAESSAPWVHLSAAAGSGSTALTVTADPYFLPYSRAATLTIGGQVVTVTQAGGNSDAPFGVIDTPIDGLTGVTGALAVTGWALDDIGVAGVRVFRDPVPGEGPGLVYVGAATFVEGARPDVAAFMPTLPYATRAGWGLQVLTNGLPDGGTGTYRLWAFAEDVEGHSTPIGTRTFTADNGTAMRPFGALDTPGNGEIVSGTIVNFGWVLTPPPGMVPLDGSTIDVVIDGVSIGHPAYNAYRSDIAALFPGYANSDGAVGYLMIDTTTLANGLHTIAWVVRDDLGRSEGIGSRFFTVFNP